MNSEYGNQGRERPYLANKSLLRSVELRNGVHILFAVISKAVSTRCFEDHSVGFTEIKEEGPLLVLLDSLGSDLHIVVIDVRMLRFHNEWEDVG